jgi:hypothetical protein
MSYVPRAPYSLLVPGTELEFYDVRMHPLLLLEYNSSIIVLNPHERIVPMNEPIIFQLYADFTTCIPIAYATHLVLVPLRR